MQKERHTRRRIHNTPVTECRQSNFLLPGYSTRTHIQTILISRYIDSLPLNTLFLAPHPPIAEEESLLTRAKRVSLTRARCELFTLFPTYTYRIKLVKGTTTSWMETHRNPRNKSRHSARYFRIKLYMLWSTCGGSQPQHLLW